MRNLVEAHGGVIRAASEGAGHGATFTVQLPMRAVFGEEQAPTGEGAPASGTELAAPIPGERALAGARILVVDDDDDSRELLSVVLKSAGADVVSAASAALALDAYARHPVDLVISDIGMPVMDGYELIRALRTKDAHVRAIALTAYARAEDAERAVRAGFASHLPKPVDVSELFARARRVLDRTS